MRALDKQERSLFSVGMFFFVGVRCWLKLLLLPVFINHATIIVSTRPLLRSAPLLENPVNGGAKASSYLLVHCSQG